MIDPTVLSYCNASPLDKDHRIVKNFHRLHIRFFFSRLVLEEFVFDSDLVIRTFKWRFSN